MADKKNAARWSFLLMVFIGLYFQAVESRILKSEKNFTNNNEEAGSYQLLSAYDSGSSNGYVGVGGGASIGYGSSGSGAGGGSFGGVGGFGGIGQGGGYDTGGASGRGHDSGGTGTGSGYGSGSFDMGGGKGSGSYGQDGVLVLDLILLQAVATGTFQVKVDTMSHIMLAMMPDEPP